MHLGHTGSGNRAWFLAVLGTVALLASACGLPGSSDGDESGATVEEADPVTDSIEGASAATGETISVESGEGSSSSSADGGAAGGSISALEASWAERRAAIVELIETSNYGVNADGVLIGPSGFELDLSACPAEWSDTEGIGESIAIGYLTARSGSLQTYGFVADGMAAYFDHVNATGGIDGVPLELVIEDDEYKADRTVELVDELVDTGRVFAVTTLGYPGTVAVMDRLNEACVPQPFTVTSHPVWGDPQANPWTTGLQMAHSTEAVLWGSWIKSNLVADLPVKVGALVRDDAFGLAYESSFRAWADANPDVISEFVAVSHSPVPDSTVTNEMATIKASDPDVFISMTAGSYCLEAVQEAGRVELAESAKALFTSSVCRDPAAYLIPAGDAADGWNIVGGGIKATTDPRFADEPFIAFTNETLDGAGFDPAVGFYGTGFATYGWAFVEAIRIAAELDGGLTRPNFILAQRAMDLDHPVLLDGIRFSMDGAADSFPVEGSNFGVYDAANQVWVEDSPVIDVDGSTPNCSWTDAGC